MKRFSIVERGYDIDEVNRFIDIVISRLEKLNAENASYLAKIDGLNKRLNENSNMDTTKIEKALLAIQDTSDRIKELARKEADMTIDEAKNNANSIIHEALLKAEKTEHDRMILEKNIKVYKERIKNILLAELKLTEDLDSIDLRDIK